MLVIAGRSLRGGRTYTIGLLVRDFGTGYIGEIIRGIDRELRERQYDLMLYTTHGRGRREADYVATLTRGMVDGLPCWYYHAPRKIIWQRCAKAVFHMC
ncbi:MAG: hypothetical protein R2867_33345 [Caldilineaceae bacterium]